VHDLVAKGRQFWGKDSEIYLNDIMGDQLSVSARSVVLIRSVYRP